MLNQGPRYEPVAPIPGRRGRAPAAERPGGPAAGAGTRYGASRSSPGEFRAEAGRNDAQFHTTAAAGRRPRPAGRHPQLHPTPSAIPSQGHRRAPHDLPGSRYARARRRPGLAGADAGGRQPRAGDATQVVPEQDRLKSPVPDLDPGGRSVDPNTPPVPRTNVSPEERDRGRAGSESFSQFLTPSAIDFNEAQAAGFPANSRPYIINPAQALQLALANNRGYQFNLEQVYIQALPVTLQRYGFQPQFYAG